MRPAEELRCHVVIRCAEARAFTVQHERTVRRGAHPAATTLRHHQLQRRELALRVSYHVAMIRSPRVSSHNELAVLAIRGAHLPHRYVNPSTAGCSSCSLHFAAGRARWTAEALLAYLQQHILELSWRLAHDCIRHRRSLPRGALKRLRHPLLKYSTCDGVSAGHTERRARVVTEMRRQRRGVRRVHRRRQPRTMEPEWRRSSAKGK
jgi:hypothetical protein